MARRSLATRFRQAGKTTTNAYLRCRPRAAAVALVTTITVLLGAPVLEAQRLGVQGNRLTLDGAARFLVLVSYFDGVRRIPNDLQSTATLDADLQYLAARGVSGIRVFPNWQHPGDTLMDANGALEGLHLRKLKLLIDRAAAHALVVDVSFARETIAGLTVRAYANGIEATARSLKGRSNLVFDLQNEWDIHEITASDLRQIRTSVKAVDRSRLVTASFSGGYDPEQAVRIAATDGFDLLAYHDGREPTGRWATGTTDIVARLRALTQTARALLPIYLQEPNRFGRDRQYYDNDPRHYLTAVRNAKASGAAAWTFHNDPNKDLSGTTPFADLLQAGERQVLDGLRDAIGR